MFKFQLKSLLSLRENIEETKKRELGQLMYEKELFKARLEQLKLRKMHYEAQLRSNMEGQVVVQDIQYYKNYIGVLRNQYKDMCKQLEQLEVCILEKQEEAKEAMKNRKILENFKEMQLEAYLEEEKRQEQKIVDELVSYKYTKKGQEQDYVKEYK